MLLVAAEVGCLGEISEERRAGSIPENREQEGKSFRMTEDRKAQTEVVLENQQPSPGEARSWLDSWEHVLGKPWGFGNWRTRGITAYWESGDCGFSLKRIEMGSCAIVPETNRLLPLAIIGKEVSDGD